MSEKKRRRRTGCLTCRARRIKCDEGKPTCHRCEAANIICAGYQEKRNVRVRQPKQRPATSSSPTTDSSATLKAHGLGVSYSNPSPRGASLPLMAFPSNPRPAQRPHARARNILFFHQFLFRTLPILFPVEHLYFWRESICEEAWETEYVYDCVMALGGIHRACLLMSMLSENDRVRGLDTKVIALQAYTAALQGLSQQLQVAEKSLHILVGSLLLLAHFECFCGNIPAALRHVNVASHYFSSMKSDNRDEIRPFLVPIETCLQNFSLTFRIGIPYPRLTVFEHRPYVSPSNEAPSGSTLLQGILNLVSAKSEWEDLIWQPPVDLTSVTSDEVRAFQMEIRSWKVKNNHVLPHLDSDGSIESSLDVMNSTIDELPIPPEPHSITSVQICLVLAVYNFCMARTTWALILLGDGSERTERAAYLYFYEVMRYAATISNKLPHKMGPQTLPDDIVLQNIHKSNSEYEALYVPCEVLRIGFLPILYITGQCTPQPKWLKWVIEQLKEIGQEGISSGQALAKCLEGLQSLELNRDINSLDRFPCPASRIIAVLIPETDGHGFVAYYARARSGMHQSHILYHTVAQSRWSRRSHDDESQSNIEILDQTRTVTAPFTRYWLLHQPVSHQWMAWSMDVQFDLDGALHDHISGSNLSPS
ncbi:hypothetical protein F5884DRAFT_737842 [Xylogone sp. PMI_703]|nr:hypothetical protein F5884DRAFT_737842 [Xylogone sp. PMI_703]